jgi:hypothetical protein
MMSNVEWNQARRTRGWLMLLVGLSALFIAWRFLRQDAVAAASRSRGPAEAPEPAPHAWDTPELKGGFASPLAAKPGAQIDSIEVDKSEVCYGEENFANIRAHDETGGSDRLIVRLGGSREMGLRVPFRIDRANAATPRRIIVSGGGGPPVMATIPEVKLKDCDVAERVTIDVSLTSRSPHLLTLKAGVNPAPAGQEAFEAVSYEWDFGDGTKQASDSPSVEHSYEGVPQTTRFAYFLMSVKLRDRRGRELSGSRAYGFPNFGFGEFLDNHEILLTSAGGSEAGEGTAGAERVRLYHGFDKPVQLERVRVRDVRRGAAQPAGSAKEYAPQALLGVTLLPPHASTSTIDLSALRPSEPDTQRRLELVGAAGSIRAHGEIVLTSTARTAAQASNGDAEADAPAVDSADRAGAVDGAVSDAARAQAD